MIRAAITLFSLNGEAPYLEWAEAWFAAAKRHHYIESVAAYNLLADDAPTLIAQPLSVTDEATPAATGVMAGNAATLFMLTGDPSYREHAERLLGHLSNRPGHDIIGAASLQSSFDTLLRGRLAYILGEGEAADALVAAARSEADPALLATRLTTEAVRQGHPAEGKRPTGAAAMFLCDAFKCLPELASAGEAAEMLEKTRTGLD
jgi:uncharacterized protein YyaL (SSP411 family)